MTVFAENAEVLWTFAMNMKRGGKNDLFYKSLSVPALRNMKTKATTKTLRQLVARDHTNEEFEAWVAQNQVISILRAVMPMFVDVLDYQTYNDGDDNKTTPMMLIKTKLSSHKRGFRGRLEIFKLLLAKVPKLEFPASFPVRNKAWVTIRAKWGQKPSFMSDKDWKIHPINPDRRIA